MKKAILIPFIFLSVLQVPGQTTDKSELKEYFLDAEFFFTEEEYVDALYDYMELYNDGYSNNANINYRMGVCYLNIPGQKDKSISFLSMATKNVSTKYKAGSFKETRAPMDAWLFLGNAYRVNNQLDTAIEVYTHYKTLTKSADEIKYADQQIAACKMAIVFMNEPKDIRRTNLGVPINTNSSNFKAVVSGDGRRMVYMNELPFYDAVYFSTFVNGAWTEPVNITPQIQSDGDQYVSAISFDGSTLYLTREGTFDSDIMISHFENGKWTKSVPIGGNINTKYWESHASVSKDGKTMYFSSNRKGGPGSMDIFVSRHNELGQWGVPVALGENINTVLNEDTPFITENDSLLYFSSQGHTTMGGYDIFCSRLLPSGAWSEPENLKYPINTTDDDLFYFPWHNGRIGYVSEYDNNGIGKEDIYAIQAGSDKTYAEVLADLVKEEVPSIRPEEKIMAEEKPVPDTTMKPSELEKLAEKLPAEQEQVMKEPSEIEKVAETVQPQPSQEEKQPAAIERPVEKVQTEPQPEEKAKPETMVDKLAKETAEAMVREIVLNPVYFAFDNYQLSETGKTELKKLADFMQTVPASTLKLFGYADAIGPADYNIILSEKRAIAAMKFMISIGVEAKRMTIKGLGETNFAAINKNPDGTDCPEGRRLNRRVEFEVWGIDTDKIMIKRPEIPENLRYKGN
jgi:outer membrane protein OmpA-like peptidoglycan-associated protein